MALSTFTYHFTHSPLFLRIILGSVLAITSCLNGLRIAHADDEDSRFSRVLGLEELNRARILFRHYCMDCHGPKLMGREYDHLLLCPNVQGEDVDDYRETVLEGDNPMPRFRLGPESDGYLTLTDEDLFFMTIHEASFRRNQP